MRSSALGAGTGQWQRRCSPLSGSDSEPGQGHTDLGIAPSPLPVGGGGSPQHVLLAPDFISYREVSAGVTILCQGSGEDSLDRRITENHLGRITEVLGVKGSLSGSQGSFLKKVPCSSEIGELEEEKSPARYVSRSKTSSNPLRFCPQDTPFYR